MDEKLRNNLEERLVSFSVQCIEIANELPANQSGKHLSGQLIKSGTSAPLNYGEAQAAESRKDFIHKMKIVLKELKETSICLKIIHRTNIYKSEEKIVRAINENDELNAIVFTSIETAQRNLQSLRQ
jgi:four helix bundle protein